MQIACADWCLLSGMVDDDNGTVTGKLMAAIHEIVEGNFIRAGDVPHKAHLFASDVQNKGVLLLINLERIDLVEGNLRVGHKGR